VTHKPVAILGAGNVGMALASAFIAKGESVVFGVPTRQVRKGRVHTWTGGTRRFHGRRDPRSELVILSQPVSES